MLSFEGVSEPITRQSYDGRADRDAMRHAARVLQGARGHEPRNGGSTRSAGNGLSSPYLSTTEAEAAYCDDERGRHRRRRWLAS